MSTKQALATVIVFDYLYDAQGNPLANQEVVVQLAYNKATYINPVVSVPNNPIRVLTDANGYWQANLVQNSNLNPANTTYSVRSGGQAFDIAVPAGAGPFQASAIATGTVPALVGGFNAQGNGTVGGNLTVTGSIVQQGTAALVTALFVSSLQGITLTGRGNAQIMPLATNGLLMPSGQVAVAPAGTPTPAWSEPFTIMVDHAGGFAQHMSFQDANAAPYHAWVVGLGMDGSDALEFATATGQSVKARLVFGGSLQLIAGQGLDTIGAGALNLGPTSATSVIMGRNGQSIGFYGSAGTAKPTVTGSKGANAALTSLMTALAGFGLVVDSTT